MPYNLRIKNADGEFLRGVVYYYDAEGFEIGQSVVYPAGSDLDPEMVETSDTFRVTAAGYSFYGASSSNIGEYNTVTLVKEKPVLMYAIVGAAAGIVLSRFFFPKFFKFLK